MCVVSIPEIGRHFVYVSPRANLYNTFTNTQMQSVNNLSTRCINGKAHLISRKHSGPDKPIKLYQTTPGLLSEPLQYFKPLSLYFAPLKEPLPLPPLLQSLSPFSKKECRPSPSPPPKFPLTSEAPACLVWHNLVWHGFVWYGLVWYRLVWYGFMWYSLVWHDGKGKEAPSCWWRKWLYTQIGALTPTHSLLLMLMMMTINNADDDNANDAMLGILVYPQQISLTSSSAAEQN